MNVSGGLSAREKVIALIFLCVCGVALLVKFVLMPYWMKKENDKAALDRSSAKYVRLLAKKQDIAQEMAILRGELSPLITQSDGAQELFSLIKKSGRSTGIKDLRIEVQEAREGDSVVTFPVDIRFKGVWSTVVKMVLALEGKELFLLIDDIKLTASDQDGVIAVSLAGRLKRIK